MISKYQEITFSPKSCEGIKEECGGANLTLMIDVVGGGDEKNEPMEDRRKDGEGERRREGGKSKK